MAFPPRPRSSRAEPSFAPVGASSRDAVPLRPAVPRVAARPAAADAAAEREPMRLAAEPRRAPEAPSLSLSASDRLIVSSAGTGNAKRQGGLWRVLGLALLLAFAAFGAYSLYQWLAPLLP